MTCKESLENSLQYAYTMNYIIFRNKYGITQRQAWASLGKAYPQLEEASEAFANGQNLFEYKRGFGALTEEDMTGLPDYKQDKIGTIKPKYAKIFKWNAFNIFDEQKDADFVKEALQKAEQEIQELQNGAQQSEKLIQLKKLMKLYSSA
jgi:hypothetical protein